MTTTGRADASVFKRYNIRRGDVQADALQQQERYLSGQRDSTVTVPSLFITRIGDPRSRSAKTCSPCGIPQQAQRREE